MPKPPAFLDKVQGIVDFVEDPCHAPWLVYLQLARPALGNAVITLLSFGMDDVFRGWVKPSNLKPLRGFRRFRGGGRRGGRGGGIPEIGEMIGKHLPGAGGLNQATYGGTTRFIWTIDGAIQRVLWYWLVLDVTVTFFYDWASAVQESRFCRASSGVRAGGSGGAVGFPFNLWRAPPHNMPATQISPGWVYSDLSGATTGPIGKPIFGAFGFGGVPNPNEPWMGKTGVRFFPVGAVAGEDGSRTMPDGRRTSVAASNMGSNRTIAPVIWTDSGSMNDCTSSWSAF